MSRAIFCDDDSNRHLANAKEDECIELHGILGVLVVLLVLVLGFVIVSMRRAKAISMQAWKEVCHRSKMREELSSIVNDTVQQTLGSIEDRAAHNPPVSGVPS